MAFFNPENIFNGGDYDAQQILVEVDGYVEYLLTNETVTIIVVDEANRNGWAHKMRAFF